LRKRFRDLGVAFTELEPSHRLLAAIAGVALHAK
jgi:hypothetical protein